MSPESRLKPSDLASSKEKLDNLSRYLVELIPPQNSPLLAFIEISAEESDFGSIAIPLRYKNIGATMDKNIFTICVFNKRPYLSSVSEIGWREEAGRLVLKSWGFQRGQKVGAFEVGIAKLRPGGSAYEKVFFKTSEGITADPDKSAIAIVKEFQNSFTGWQLVPMNVKELESFVILPVQKEKFRLTRTP